ncbi:MAG: carbonic anhydrase [Micrococcales bacterium]|nr:MAG: carbonic anhydrase [Micrococcales bacterium]PIE26035.1 MAG: carbonic anhydrase [Micrococcales bacterium]
MSTSPTASAWQRLMEGNARFRAGEPVHPNTGLSRVRDLGEGQHPFAVIVACSDSRVPPEVITDQGLGDLFVIRTAGHVLDDAGLGSIDYAVTALGVPLIVVLGHTGCGAVHATMQAVAEGVTPGGALDALVDAVRPSVERATGAGGSPTVDDVVTEHVRASIDLLLDRSEPVAQAKQAGSLTVAGAVYQLADGMIRQVS